MTTLSEYTSSVTLLVPGNHNVDSLDLDMMREKAVDQALSTVNRHRPRIAVGDISGSGEQNYDLSALPEWAAGFSTLREVEYPLDTDEQRGPVLAEEQWVVIDTPTGPVLRFLDNQPDATETIRLRYTARHTCTVSGCTIAADDEEAVQRLAAANYCMMLAAAYALDQDSTINADAVNHDSRSQKYERLALRYRQAFNRHFGIQEGKPKPASVTRDQDRQGSWAGDHLTHKGRYR